SPTAWTCAAFAAVPQSSLVAITCWSDERTRVSVGLARGLAMPAAASDGPAAVITTVFGNAPPTMKPPIITSLPVRTSMRVEMLASRGGSDRGRGGIDRERHREPRARRRAHVVRAAHGRRGGRCRRERDRLREL